MSEAGGKAALAALREASTSLGKMRPLTGLGTGAFVARRVLAFVSGRRLIELQAGYSSADRLQPSPARLVRLARVVAAR